jgi:hypothetical protein
MRSERSFGKSFPARTKSSSSSIALQGLAGRLKHLPGGVLALSVGIECNRCVRLRVQPKYFRLWARREFLAGAPSLAPAALLLAEAGLLYLSTVPNVCIRAHSLHILPELQPRYRYGVDDLL